MKVFFILLLFCVGAEAGKNDRICKSGNEDQLTPFNRKAGHMAFPCKYWALKDQQCGPYIINLIPGNKWVQKMYRLDSLWLNIRDANDETSFWEGRTSNENAAKFYTKEITNLFVAKSSSGSLNMENPFKTTRIDKKEGVCVEDGGNFMVCFKPWAPKQSKFKHSTFKFQCFHTEENNLKGYPPQMCGGSSLGDEYLLRTESKFNVTKRDFKILGVYYDRFMNTQIKDDYCAPAADILANLCPDDAQRKLALEYCFQILASQRHTECVASHGYDIMEVFTDCINWGCTGDGFVGKKHFCSKPLHDSVVLCPPFASATLEVNLTDLVRKSQCYEDIIPIDKQRQDMALVP